MQRYEAIENGIKTGDVEALREAVGSICYTCRSFSNGEFDEVVEYVISSGVQLFDVELVGELVSTDKESFTDEDFAKAVFELKQNFTKERIEDVKSIGRALYKDEADTDSESVDGEASDENITKAPEDEYESKYDNGKANPLKRLLNSIREVLCPRSDEDGANNDKNDAPTPTGSSLFDVISGREKEEKDEMAEGGEYLDSFRVSEEELREGNSEDKQGGTDSAEEKKRSFDLSKIDPVYIAAGAVGVLTVALIIIAFLQ